MGKCSRRRLALRIALLVVLVGSSFATLTRAAQDLHISITSAGEISTGVIPEPADCLGPLSALPIFVTLSNGTDAASAATFAATLDPGWTVIPDSCLANIGVCTIQNEQNVTWAGTIDPFSIASVTFGLRVDSSVPAGTELCVTLVAQFEGGEPLTARDCITTNSARQCGLGAPSMSAGPLAALGGLLLVSGLFVLRRRAR